MILILLKQKKIFCLKCSYDEEQSVFCKDFLFTPSLSIFNHVVLVEQMCFDKMCFTNHSAFLKLITQKSVQKDALCIWVFYRKLSLLYMYYNICKYEKFKIWYFYLFIYHILSVSLPFRCVLFIESFYTHYPLSYVDVICRILEIQNVIYIYLIQCKSRTSSTRKKN